MATSVEQYAAKKLELSSPNKASRVNVRTEKQ
jgi:hypothetical protein